MRLGNQLKLGVETDLSRVVAYILHRPKALKNCSGTLLIDSETADIKHAIGIFTRPDPELEKIVSDLPEGCSLLASTGSEVMIGWNEKGSEEAVETISRLLEDLRHWSERKPKPTIQDSR